MSEAMAQLEQLTEADLLELDPKELAALTLIFIKIISRQYHQTKRETEELRKHNAESQKVLLAAREFLTGKRLN